MYSYFQGKVTVIDPKYIVLEVNKIGYQIQVANPYQYQLHAETTVFIQQIVNENEIYLCGFLKIEEKDLFLDLISVKGIGPKTGLLILAAATVLEIKKAIITQDSDYLTKFPKIGQKSAKQIILDLEKKYKNIGFETNKNDSNEVVEALLALGYPSKVIKKVIVNLDQSQSTEVKIKAALKLLLNL